MGPEAILALQLIAKVGIPVAKDLWALFKSAGDITLETWAKAEAINARSLESYEQGPVK